MLDDRGRRAVSERVADEVVPIALVAQREEDLAGADDARIEGTADVSLVTPRAPTDEPAAGGGEEIVEREHQRMVPTDQGRSGCTRTVRSASVAMSRNAAMAVTVP